MRSPTVGTTVTCTAVLSQAAISLLLVMLLTATGCTKTADKKSTAAADGGNAEAAVADGETDGVDFDTAIAVDDGKVEACSPMGWTRGPQSKSYLVKYVPSRKKTYPSIVVMAADAPEGIVEVDAGSQKDFVAAIAASLAGTFSKNGKSTLLQKPAASRLGPHFGATWAAPATINVDGMKETIDRTSYAAVIGGRMYTVEVRAPKGKLDSEGRAAARAVAAALAPPAVGEAAPAAEEAAPATEEVPAAETDAAAEQK
ncbi:MAG: hypothetical protein NTY17_11145 [Planctomycetia bacterium]|nr:hypothetical protein [Planctomycetia bacterium]